MRKEKKSSPANKPTYQGYSYGFKVQIVERIENGQFSCRQAAEVYKVSRNSVTKWMKKYGNLDKKLRGMSGKSLKQEIAELKRKLKKAEAERDLWKVSVEIIEDELGIDVKKKYLSDADKRFLKRHNLE